MNWTSLRVAANIGRRRLSTNAGSGSGTGGSDKAILQYLRSVDKKRENEQSQEIEKPGSLLTKIIKEEKLRFQEQTSSRHNTSGSKKFDRKGGDQGNQGVTTRGNQQQHQDKGPPARIFNARNAGKGGKPAGRGGRDGARQGGGFGGVGKKRGTGGDFDDDLDKETRRLLRQAKDVEDSDEDEQDAYNQYPSGGSGYGDDENGQFVLKGSQISRDVAMDPIDKVMLSQHDFFQEMVEKGEQTIDTEEFDAIDELMADSFIECFKTADHSVSYVFEDDAKRRARLPQIRSIAQLQAFCRPPELLNSPADSEGARLAEQAWGVIHQNYHYRDSEKYRLVESIATYYNKLEAHLSNLDEQEGGTDLVLQAGFRKGNEYYKEEKRLLELNKPRETEDLRFVQSETDWSVQAVVDEDDL